MHIKPHSQKSNLFLKRTVVLSVFFSVLLALLLTRLIYLQIVENRLYTTLSDKNQLSMIPTAPPRGLIYDRNGVLLADNIPVHSIDLVRDRTTDVADSIARLSKLINIKPEETEAFYKTAQQYHDFEPVPLKYKLTEEEIARFYTNRYAFPEGRISTHYLRYYPKGFAMAHILGYAGRIDSNDLKQIDPANYSASDYIGKIGVEKFHESLLHGQTGYKQIEVDARGRVIQTLKEVKPTSGEALYLTIDSQLQNVTLDAFGDEIGAVVAIEPSTGQVLALVSHPSYDGNLFSLGMDTNTFKYLNTSKSRPLYNRAIKGQYPLASTIKPFLALQALNTGAITKEDVIEDKGVFILPGTRHVYHDSHIHGNGRVDLNKAIIVSSDIYFYQLAVKMGMQTMNEILAKFGFGKPTGIEIPAEARGLLPTPQWKKKKTGRSWYTGDTVISGIGQGFMLTTPLQLANAVATLANRGLRYQPTLIRKRVLPDGTIVENSPKLVEHIVLNNPNDWETVIHAMEGVIRSEAGTGKNFGRHPPYSVAGKTGTAEVYRPQQYQHVFDKERPKPFRNHGLFIAFAPVDHPKIAVAVIVEHGNVAPIIARKVLDAYLKKAL